MLNHEYKYREAYFTNETRRNLDVTISKFIYLKTQSIFNVYINVRKYLQAKKVDKLAT